MDLEEIVDAEGNVRRLGSLIPEQKNLLGAPLFSSKFPTWDDSDIRKALQDKNRKPARVTFGKNWIHNQGSFGSCNGWATAGAFARARWRRGIMDGMQFSGSFVYSQINGNADRGSALADGMKQAMKGIAPLQYSPPDRIYSRQISPEAYNAAGKHKALLETTFHVSTLQELKTGLAMQLGAADIAVHAGSRFSKLNNRGVCGLDAGRGNHAVVCDDLIEDGGTFLFDMANSWGLSFGTEGRGYLTEDHLKQTIKYHDFFFIVDVVEDD